MKQFLHVWNILTNTMSIIEIEAGLDSEQVEDLLIEKGYDLSYIHWHVFNEGEDLEII